MTRRTHIFWILLIAGTILVTRATTFLVPLIDDEETFAVIGRIILHGGLPYLDVIDNKPPLLYYFYAFWLWLFGDTHTTALHAVGIAWVALTCRFIFQIGRRITSEGAGYFAALAYAIFTTTFVPAYIALHASLILALPLTISVWAFLRFYDTRHIPWMVVAGLCCGAAVFFKFQALVQIPFLLLALGYLCLKRLIPAIAFIMGVMAVIAAMLAFLNHHQMLQAFYDATWAASMTYMKEGGAIGDYWRRFGINVGSYVLATIPLWVGAAVQLMRRPRSPLDVLILGWLAASIPSVLAGGRFYGHYFIQLLPPLCLMAGITFDRFWNRNRAARLTLATLFAICAVGWMIPRIWFQEFADRFHIQNLRVEKQIGDYLAAHTQPGSRIFVWGMDPAIYFLSGRDPATRFLWSDSLTGRLPGVPETQRGNLDTRALVHEKDWTVLMSDLTRNPPLYIVDCASGNLRDYGKFPIRNYPVFHHFVTQNYDLDTLIEGVALYHRH